MFFNGLKYVIKISTIYFFFIIQGCTKEVPDMDILYFEQNISTAGAFEQNSVNTEADLGVILLPDNYTPNGLPVPLVIYCHSGGGSVYRGSSEAQHQAIVKYLVYKGYAVISVAGMPESYSKRLNIDHGRTVGSHIAHRAYESAYKYAIHTYNLKKDGCFILANSNGGLSMMNLHNLTDIPILSMVGIFPLLNTRENTWNVPSGSLRSDGFPAYQNRANVIRIFGMKNIETLEELKNAQYEQDKVGMYDPYEYCLSNKEFVMRAPLLVFSSPNDLSVKRIYVERLASELNPRSTKHIIISNEEELGGHNVQAKPVYVGEFIYKGEVLKINLTFKLIYEFFETYR